MLPQHLIFNSESFSVLDYNPYHLSSLLGGLQFVDSNVHGISGTVTLPDSRTIVINDFNYDGLGVGKRECYIYLYAKLM